MFLGQIVISDLSLFQDIVLLSPCFKFSKKLMLSFIDKVRTETYSLALFIWNVAPVVFFAAPGWTGGLASGSPTTLAVIDIIWYYKLLWSWQIMLYFTMNQ